MRTFAPDFQSTEDRQYAKNSDAAALPTEEARSGREITVTGGFRIVLTKTVLHETCKMDFCCIINQFIDIVCKQEQTLGGIERG